MVGKSLFYSMYFETILEIGFDFFLEHLWFIMTKKKYLTDDSRSEGTTTGVETRVQKAGKIAAKPFNCCSSQWPVVFPDDRCHPEEAMMYERENPISLSLSFLSKKKWICNKCRVDLMLFPSAFCDSVKRFLSLEESHWSLHEEQR